MGKAISGGFTIDTSDLKKLTQDMEKLSPGIKKAATGVIKESSITVAAKAKTLSSWSSRIPGSIRIVGSNMRVLVRAGGARAPHARPYEMGSKQNPGQVRHPVFGHDVWTSKNTPQRPFLLPAAEWGTARIVPEMDQALVVLFREAGFH